MCVCVCICSWIGLGLEGCWIFIPVSQWEHVVKSLWRRFGPTMNNSTRQVSLRQGVTSTKPAELSISLEWDICARHYLGDDMAWKWMEPTNALKSTAYMHLVCPGGRTGLGVQEEIVYSTCPQPLGESAFGGESGAAVPLLTSAASAPRRRRQCVTHSVIPKTVKFGGCPPPQMMWEVQHRGRGVADPQVLPSDWWCAAFPGIFRILPLFLLGGGGGLTRNQSFPPPFPTEQRPAQPPNCCG